MATKRKNTKPRPKWARRRGGEEGPKRLDPALEPLVRGERQRRERRPRLTDPRPAPLVPGVKNADARAVFDHRVAALQRHKEGGDVEALEDALAEAAAMRLWRGRSLTGFDALAADVLRLDPPVAHEMARRGADRQDLRADELTPESLAVWFRIEAALVEHGLPGRARVQRRDREETLVLMLPAGDAPAALTAIGDRQRGISRDLARPRGRKPHPRGE